MDFELTREEKAFQKEMREFLDKECNENVVAEVDSMLGEGPYSKELLRKMGANKLVAPTWPLEYGGRAMGHMYEGIKVDEINTHHAPFPLDGVEIGNSLLIVGNEEQKKRFLPGIAKGEIEFALGYSEPNAGSDVASVQLRSVDNGDHFVLNGQKIYNTEAHFSDYHWLLTRSDPTLKKHRGLTLFMVDLKSPGITIRPLITMAGLRTNEVFYEDVKVPKANMVGEKNGGWAVLMSALYGGGGGGGFSTGSKRLIDTLVKYALEKKQDTEDNQWISDIMADLYIRTQVGELMGLRATAFADLKVTSLLYGGGGAAARVLGGDTRRLLYKTAMQILGPYGQLAKDSKWAPLNGEILREYMDAPRWTIVHGSQEIQKMNIATRNLGLPRK